MRFPFFRNRDSVKNGILISIRRTGDGFHPGLFMSLCIGVGTAIRIVSLLHTIKMHDYTELTGTCTKREVSPLTKKQKIIFRSTDQKEYHFTFDKNIRLLSGHYYRLYFRNVANLSGEEKVTPDLLAYEELSLNEDVSPKNS